MYKEKRKKNRIMHCQINIFLKKKSYVLLCKHQAVLIEAAAHAASNDRIFFLTRLRKNIFSYRLSLSLSCVKKGAHRSPVNNRGDVLMEAQLKMKKEKKSITIGFNPAGGAL